MVREYTTSHFKTTQAIQIGYCYGGINSRGNHHFSILAARLLIPFSFGQFETVSPHVDTTNETIKESFDGELTERLISLR